MQITIVGARDEEDFFERDLVEVALDFELISADSSGFIPMYLCSPNGAVLQFYPSDAFAFAPVSKTVSSSQPSELSDTIGDSKSLDLGNAIQDLEVHNRTN
jgi:hypothetical protein